MLLKNKIYLHELREQFLQKLVDEWELKWQKSFEEFNNFEVIKNKNAFLEALLADIEENLHKKLNGESKKYLFSKDFLRRFIFEYGEKDVRIQTHSRTAIALYLTYENWEDFVAKNKDLETQNVHINYINVNESLLPVLLKNKLQTTDNQDFIEVEAVKSKINLKKYFFSFLGIILFFTGLYFGFDWWENRPFSASDLEKVKFEVIKTVGKYPQAVRFKYDVSSLPSVKNIEVETGVGKIITASNYEADLLSSNRKIDTLAQTYFYPGIYHVILMVNKKAVKTINHIVYSKPNSWTAWGFGVAYGKDWTTNISTTKNYIKDGILHFDPSELRNEIKNEDDLRNATHVLTQHFGVNFDSLQIEVRMKNPESEGGESCYDMQISLTDKNFNNVNAKFTTEGCTDYAQLSVGTTFFRILSKPNQKNVDLDSFGVNQNDWNVFKLKVKNKYLEIFVNNKLAFQGNFETKEPVTEIIDTRFVFKGAGSIDWVKVSNSFTGKIVYQTDFEK